MSDRTSTYQSLAPEIRFSKTVQIPERDEVLADFLKTKPNWEGLGRAVGGLAYNSDPIVLQRVLESAVYPGRLDKSRAWDDAHSPRKCGAIFTEPSGGL